MAEKSPPIGRTPWLGRCADEACDWVWPVVWLPMPLETAAELMKVARCPLCGGKKVLCG